MIIIRLLESCTSLKKIDPSVLHNSTRTASLLCLALKCFTIALGQQGALPHLALKCFTIALGQQGAIPQLALKCFTIALGQQGALPHLALQCFTIALGQQQWQQKWYMDSREVIDVSCVGKSLYICSFSDTLFSEQNVILAFPTHTSYSKLDCIRKSQQH